MTLTAKYASEDPAVVNSIIVHAANARFFLFLAAIIIVLVPSA
jgi:hypothetical protein